MPYKLFVDKDENFECEVSVKNASLKGSVARLVIESENGPSFIFKGLIQDDKCIIPIKRLRGILDENSRGNIHLEVIIENTYFKPWQSKFIVEEHTSVKVAVNEQKLSKFDKPTVKVTSPINKSKLLPKKDNCLIAKQQLANICEMFGIEKNNMRSRTEDIIHIVKEYLKENTEYNKDVRSILSGLKDFLK